MAYLGSVLSFPSSRFLACHAFGIPYLGLHRAWFKLHAWYAVAGVCLVAG